MDRPTSLEGRRCRRRRALVAALAAASACGGSDPGLVTTTPTHWLDVICQQGGCVTTGDARRVTGLTSDSTGFVIGPGAGSVRLPLKQAFPKGSTANGYWRIQVLVASEGDFQVSACPSLPCSAPAPPIKLGGSSASTYVWTTIAEEGVPDAGDGGSPSTFQDWDVTMDVGGTSTVHLLDVRATIDESANLVGCIGP